jgi:acyl-CoA reductase-like NAD-dependent aldehyde dehydrogenase
MPPLCLKTVERCNSTSRILVHRDVKEPFVARLIDPMRRDLPGDPTEGTTTLGPLASERAFIDHRDLTKPGGRGFIRFARNALAVQSTA